MSFIIDANLLYVWSSMLSIIILVQFMGIFIVSNQQRGKALISIPATYAPVMNLLLHKVMMNFSLIPAKLLTQILFAGIVEAGPKA